MNKNNFEFEKTYTYLNRFDKEKYSILPDGWLSERDIDVIWTTALNAKGHVLEVGPFLGRSTSIICEARTKNLQIQSFDTIDFFPENIQEWQELFGKFGWNDPLPEVVKLWETGGAQYNFILNLKRERERERESWFEQIDNVFKGDFTKFSFSKQYDMILCDATHNVDEIMNNTPTLDGILAAGGILLCHDVVNRDMVDALCKNICFDSIYINNPEFMNSSVFIGKKCLQILGTKFKN